MFGLCVITTISLVGLVWFRSFESTLLVLMNPETITEDGTMLAGEKENEPSLFASIGETFGDIKEAVAGLFTSDKNESEEDEMIQGNSYTLPLSGDK